MTHDSADLARPVRTMVWEYVKGRTEIRTKLKYDELPKAPDSKTGRLRPQLPDRWRKAQPMVAQEAFLAMRARRSRAEFINYFTGTICSVPQRILNEHYYAIAETLLAEGEAWEDVRSLAMLAISAMAYVRQEEARG